MMPLPMVTRTLRGTDLQVSRACLGTMTFGQQVDQTTADEIVKCCFDGGINFFDTANIYSCGRSEEILGKALKGRRTKIVLASKGGMAMGEGRDEGGLWRAAVLLVESHLLRLLFVRGRPLGRTAPGLLYAKRTGSTRPNRGISMRLTALWTIEG